MLTSIIYSINFATMGMYAYILNNMKTTTKINQKSRERERENALVPVTV